MEWRNVFASNTLDKFVANAVEVKDIVALVVETAIAILGIGTEPAAPVVIGTALLSLAATASYAAIDMNNMWSSTETAMCNLQQRRDVGPGGGYVSEPFKTDVSGDWWDWHNKGD